MKTHALGDEETDKVVLSLLRQVGSVHDNIAFTESIPFELNQTSLSNHLFNEQTSTKSTISFHDINYHVDSSAKRKSFLCTRVKTGKQLLYNISGGFSPGMNAILGPSGCGKSSLLDILADRKDKKGLTGRILVFGKSRPKNYKYSIGYVVQEDIISGTLTIRENLMFSANVRLPNSTPLVERLALVNRIIVDLGLEECADTQIGTHFIRGVSGGEKRRACIGMELVLSPKILFLDEPTSGLDASTAENVMKCLHHLSRQGCTVVFSIHQPRYSIYKLFDTILLLSSGRTIYFGPSNDILSYFSSHGFQCEEHDNPADFALDVLIQCNVHSLALLHTSAASQSLKWEELITTNESRLIDQPLPRSCIDELYYVCIRTLRNTLRDPAMIASQIVVSIFLALLTGLVFNHIQNTVETGVQNRLGVIFFIVVNQIFSTTTALEPLVHEHALFVHENASGYYRVSTYFIAKLICDFLPIRLVPSLIFSTITYFLIGFQLTVKRFVVYFLTIFIGTIFGSAVCFLLASFIPIFVVSLIVVIFIFVVMMVFSGFLIDLRSIFPFLRWLRWFSAFRYATNLLTINEFTNLTFCLMNNTRICPIQGEQILEERQIAHVSVWDVWVNLLALVIMSIVALLMAYIQLLRMKKVK